MNFVFGTSHIRFCFLDYLKVQYYNVERSNIGLSINDKSLNKAFQMIHLLKNIFKILKSKLTQIAIYTIHLNLTLLLDYEV